MNVLMICFSFSESDGNHSTEDEASKADMDDIADKPATQAAGSSTLISFSGTTCNASNQLILNNPGAFLTSPHPLLLNGSPLISGTGTGVIINGLTLSDGHTVTLSPVTQNTPLLLNGSQVISKVCGDDSSPGEPSVTQIETQTSLPTVILNPQASLTSTISAPLKDGAKSSSTVSPMDFISVPEVIRNEEVNQTVCPTSISPSSIIASTVINPTPLLSLPLTQNTILSSAAPQTNTVISSHGLSQLSTQENHLNLTTAFAQMASSSTVSSTQVLPLPQVVPSIQGIPVSQLVQHPAATHVSSCPQLVPVSPITTQLPNGSSPQFQSQTVQISPSLAQIQPQNGSLSLTESTVASVTQVPNAQLSHGTTLQLPGQLNSTLVQQIQTQGIPVSSPTQVVPVSQPKDAGQPHLVPLSQVMPVSTIAGAPTGTIPFPHMVPASPSFTIPSTGGAFQILSSGSGGLGFAQGPVRISPVGPPQSVPAGGGIPSVQLLNSGVIQLPPSSPGKFFFF